MKITNKKRWIVAATALLLLAGCQTAKDNIAKEKANDEFAPDDDARSYRKFASAQEGVGAHSDGMLYTYHFDGDHLNSLGAQKLSLMLKDNDHAFPVIVYMNVLDDDHLKAREDAVTLYMTDSGLKDDQVKFALGPNPHATSSAAQNLVRYNKTEDSSVSGSNPTSPQAPGYGTGGGTGDSGIPGSPAPAPPDQH
jgi:hypothetical protein